MADQVRPFRFLHISDVLLDARLRSRDLGMSAGKRHERNKEALRSFLYLCDVARRRQLDAIFITGDLFDGQTVTASTLGSVVEAFAALEDLPVLITPGVQDPLTPQSMYHPKVLAVHGIRPWSRNVHIFADSNFTPFQHPQHPHVTIWGRAHLGASGQRVLPQLPASDGLAIAADYQPYSEEELQASQCFDLVAFGGTSRHQVFQRQDGVVLAASPGSFLGRSLSELGPRCALLYDIEPQRQPHSILLERLPSDSRQIVSVSVSINGVKPGAVADYIQKTLEGAGARAGLDLVHVQVTGIYPPGQQPALGEQQLSERYFHARVEDHCRPDYFVDRADQRTTAGRFIRFLQDLKTKAEARGGILPATEYGGAITPAQIENALYYGLEALNHKKVTVRDAD